MVDVIYEVLAPADDTFCDSANNNVTAEPLTFGKYNQVINRAFIRFQLDVPNGARIASAILRVTACATLGPWNSFLPVIRLVDSDNCPDFTANPFSVAVSTLGSQFDARYWVTSAVYDIDVSLLLQEHVNRSGYVPGSYMGLRIDEGNSLVNERQAGWQKGTRGTPCRLIVSFVPTHLVSFEATPIQVAVQVDGVAIGFTPVAVELEEKSHQVQVPSSQQG